MASQQIKGQGEMPQDIMSEISDISKRVCAFSPIISILGSARTEPASPLYLLTRSLAQQLSAQGYSIMTGAGYGLMQAANEGARLGGASSIGIMVDAFFDKRINSSLDACLYVKNVTLRKQTFIRCSQAIICFPGGFGSLDEISEILLSYQASPEQKVPLVLIDTHFWAPFISWIKQHMLSRGLIDPIDLTGIYLLEPTDDLAQGVTRVLSASACCK